MHPIQISCISLDWRGVVTRTLSEIHEIDLVHFLVSTDGQFCADIASKYAMDFTASPGKHVAFFRKQTLGFKPKTGAPPKLPGSKIKNFSRETSPAKPPV